MKLLVIDPGGEGGLDLAMRAQRHNHSVKYFVKNTPKTELIGKGLVDRVDDFKPWWRWADLVVATGNDLYLRDYENLSKAYPVPLIAACQQAAEWEINRPLGQALLRKHGIATLPAKEFSDYDPAIAHVKKHDVRFVSKPAGDDSDKAMSYVSKSPADMVYMLERWKRLGKLKGPFILQEFMPGIEMGIAGWFGPGGWNEGWEENFEFKKMMNGDLGVNTGEQGTVMRYVRTSKLARKMLVPLTAELERVGYVGDIDVNCIIDEKGHPWPLEFTCRLGWPAFHLQNALQQGDPAEWLLDLATGKDSRSFPHDKVCVGVVMSIPDYPYSHLTRKEVVGVPIYGMTERLMQHWHPCQMMMGHDVPNVIEGHHIKQPMAVTAGDYVGVMTAVSDTIKDAALTVYRRLEKLTVPNSPMYRTDIGKRLAKQLPTIQKFGYAEGMVYSPTS
jgi:phosphoribosylamine---glycine ligase